MEPRPPGKVDLILYHADCPDGFGAAWALHQKYGGGPQYRPLHYAGQLDPADVEGKDVLMVDVSLPRDQIQAIQERARSFLLIDHHQTALDNLTGLPGCYLDMHRSGAGLAWDLAFPGRPRPPLIDLVETRDLWKWERDPNAKMLCRVLDTEPMALDSWSAFNDRLAQEALRPGLLAEAKAMQRQYEAIIRDVAKEAVPVVLQGRRGLAACVPHLFASDVGSVLAQREGSSFGFTWCVTKDGQKVRGSWRSGGDRPPVIELAQAFGGGGHPNAAGAVISFDALREILSSGVALQDEASAGSPTEPAAKTPKMG